ncbi:MAG: sulfide/dihydroorotate dehydrogenase-like FAD/NAD-binding protein [Clostridiales bacterium]|jgi:ferredoxin--NADP+ reductase|nr:sulfide/dihydroorotate dehydrogenase-like FAD/NAD-binding protein [Clostridiales bacterium]
MNKIIAKRTLAPSVNEYVIDAPAVARHALAGQFVILRVDAEGERVPFTICDFDPRAGSVTILVQEVGYTTKRLAGLNAGEYLADFAGPLGRPTDLSEFKSAVLVGGGIGAAVVYPQAKRLFGEGRPADVIIGARAKELIMYETELKTLAKNLYLTTDDGSYARKGFVTDVLKELLERGDHDCVFAVGPMPMMRAVANLTRGYNVRTVVSMNSTMVDGTGMCGCCRVSVGGEVKYACVHGPEFDGHLIDFDEAINRSRAYRDIESEHLCRLTNAVRG